MHYLKTVLQGLVNKKQLDAEDLYKLNEATFNMPEEDNIDDKISSKLFAALEKAVTAYTSGKHDTGDANFLYDYVALLGTMQNQHFFTTKQNQMIVSWLKEALGGGDAAQEEKSKSNAKGDAKVLSRLEEDNRKLHAEVSKLKDLAAAVLTLKTIKLPEASKGGGKGKGGGKSEGKGDSGKSKSKGKGEADPPADPARKELKAQVNTAGRVLAKKKREVMEKYSIEASDALDHEEVAPFLQNLKDLKEKYMSMRKPGDKDAAEEEAA